MFKKANEYRQSILTRRSLSRWKSMKNNWKQIYKERHIYPVIYWGMELLRKSLHQWKSNVKAKKAFDLRCQTAIKWRQEHTFKRSVARVFEVSFFL